MAKQPMSMQVEQIIETLKLEPLPQEGGWFRRTRTEPGKGNRPTMTCIYALFTADQFSALHRLDAMETLFYQAGDPFEMLSLVPGGKSETIRIGADVDLGEVPHHHFKSGVWFGGRPNREGKFGYSLISAVVCPGFSWEGFELGRRVSLAKEFPEFEKDIRTLTRG